MKIFKELLAYPELRNSVLVLVGKEMTKEMRAFINDQKIAPYVVEMISVDKEVLVALYGKAEALIFPSIAEGFGWPIIEAQAMGCPVFTSSRPPMAEIEGQSQWLIDIDPESKAALQIQTHLQAREDIANHGLKNCERFKESTIRAQYLEFFSEMEKRID